MHGEHLHLDTIQVERRHRHVLEIEHHLHQRVTRGIARHLQAFHDFFERHILVLVGGQRGAVDAFEQLAHAGIAVQIEPYRQGVDEQADQTVQLGSGAIGDRTANAEMLLPGMARQYDAQRCQK